MAQQGLFGKKPVQEQPDDRFLEVTRRTRTLEERYSTIERRAQLMEENIIESNRKLSSEVRALNADIADIKKSVADLNEKLQLFAAEMQDFARKEDVDVVKKYLQYWDPLSFVTQKQVEKVVADALSEKKKEK